MVLSHRVTAATGNEVTWFGDAGLTSSLTGLSGIHGLALWPGALWLIVVLESPSIIVTPILQMEKPRL